MLHLILVGSGDACVLPAVALAAHDASAAAAPAGSRGMPGMAMPDRSGSSDEQECGAPRGTPAGHRLPASSCQSMAPCAPAANAATPTTVESPTVAVGAGPVGVASLAPDSRKSAPEPPPPRA